MQGHAQDVQGRLIAGDHDHVEPQRHRLAVLASDPHRSFQPISPLLSAQTWAKTFALTTARLLSVAA